MRRDPGSAANLLQHHHSKCLAQTRIPQPVQTVTGRRKRQRATVTAAQRDAEFKALALHCRQLRTSRSTIKVDFSARFYRSAFRHNRTPLKKTDLSPLASHRGYFKVQVVMQLAARIEARATHRTDRPAIQVLTDAQLSPARAAQHCLLFEFILRPNPSGMACFQFVTAEAAIICAAAVEFHRDDVEFAAVVRAARAPIYLEPSYRYSCNRELHVTLLLHGLSKVWRTQQRLRNLRISLTSALRREYQRSSLSKFRSPA